MALALVGSVATSYFGALRARRLVIEGQGQALLRALSGFAGMPPSQAGVDAFVEQYAGDGVTYAALRTPWGLLEAGEASGVSGLGLREGQELEIRRVNGRVRAARILLPPDAHRKGPPKGKRRGRHHRSGGRGPYDGFGHPGKGGPRGGFGPLGKGPDGFGPPHKHGPPEGFGPPSKHGRPEAFDPPSKHGRPEVYGPASKHGPPGPPSERGPAGSYGPSSKHGPPSKHGPAGSYGPSSKHGTPSEHGPAGDDDPSSKHGPPGPPSKHAGPGRFDRPSEYVRPDALSPAGHRSPEDHHPEAHGLGPDVGAPPEPRPDHQGRRPPPSIIGPLDRGRPALSKAGPASPIPAGRDFRGATMHVPWVVGDRATATTAVAAFRKRAGRRWDPKVAPHMPHMPFAIVEFRPVVADGLAHASGLSLVLGLVAAGLFAAFGLALRRAEAKERTLQARAEQDRRLAAIGEMSAVLAHEIRNPLTSLKGHALLLQEALPEGRPQEKAKRVIKEAERLEALTTDLLSYVRSGALHRRKVDPTALVRTAMAAIGVEQFVVDATEAPASWSLDPDRLRQALENILKNAAQATAFEDFPDAAPAEVSIRQQGRTLVFEIRDHGPGISSAHRERLFEAFYTHRTRGTGLGLAVATRVVQQHGGTIAADNHPDGGAVFTIRVPAAPTESSHGHDLSR